MHRTGNTFLPLLLTMLSGFGDVVLADDATADSCRMCHRGQLSLESDSKDALIERIRAATSGEKTHPSELPQLSDKELATLADELMSD